MADPLRPVPLQELQHLGEAGLSWTVNQPLAELPSLTPVRGQLSAVHRGTVLEVAGEAATIITLCCDRCLQHFNHPLRAEAHELIWLGEGPPPEAAAGTAEAAGAAATEPGLLVDLDPGALADGLDPRGSFDPEHWLFEQLSLQLPLVNRCGPACPGPPAFANPEPAAAAGPAGDPRWAALAALIEPPAAGPDAPTPPAP